MMKDLQKRAIFSPSEQGATLVEFAIMAVLAIGIFGVFIDVSIGLAAFNNLTNVTEEISRHIAVSRNSCLLQCQGMDLRPFIEDDINLAKKFDELQADGASFTGELVNGSTRLRVSSTLPLNCVFCTFLPQEVEFDTTSESLLEVRTCFAGC
jgi:Flp pilus assembly pilin Flp